METTLSRGRIYLYDHSSSDKEIVGRGAGRDEKVREEAIEDDGSMPRPTEQFYCIVILSTRQGIPKFNAMSRLHGDACKSKSLHKETCHLFLSCWNSLVRSAAEIICWDQLLRLSVEIICCDQLLRLSVEISCWDYLLRSTVEIICWDYLLGSAVKIICCDQLLRLYVKIGYWDYLLRVYVVISCWDYLLWSAVEIIC